MRIVACVLVIFLLNGCSPSDRAIDKEQVEGRVNKRPNLILIVADDLGLGDIGSFGSEIETPHLDSLVDQGLRLTSFHSLPSCSPTRSVLLTGVDNHLNGMGTMAEDRLPHHQGLPGYVGHLNQDVVTVARLLQDSGYHTYMTGKWHLGFEPALRPYARGFEHTFALLNGTANHFNDQGPNSIQPKATYSRDGENIDRPTGYSSNLFTEQMLQLIEAGKGDGLPFFAYLSFTAPHWPLQAPKATIEKYMGRYDSGWDSIREQRFQRLKELGLVAEELKLPERLPEVPAWTELSPDEQRNEAKKMAVYAAMVDNLDTNVGSLVQYLKDTGQYNNSVIMFMSDNGTDPYDRSERSIYQEFFAANRYDNSYQNMGAGNSYPFYGPGWAQVGSVYQSYYKFLPTEGGMRTPFILTMPEVLGEGQNMDAFASVLDITPTLLNLANVKHPGENYKKRDIHKPTGRSMVPYLKGVKETLYSSDEPVSFELFGHASVFMGDWKAVRIRPPWGDNSWSLFNLETDPGEQVDLSKSAPEQLAVLTAAYEQYKAVNGVITEPEDATAYPNKPGYIKFKD